MEILFLWDQGGHEITIVNKMSNKRFNSNNKKNLKLLQVVELLKFVLTLDDEEIVKSTIESVIELLEEEVNK